jgi:hypothetical protein
LFSSATGKPGSADEEFPPHSVFLKYVLLGARLDMVEDVPILHDIEGPA